MIRLFFCVVFLLLSLCHYGQEIGIFYTKNGSKLSGDKPQGYRIKPDEGFAIGIYADFNIAPDVDISLRPSYLKIQSRVTVRDSQSPDGSRKDTLDFSINYFTLPVLFKFSPEKSDRFYFIGGPMIGFLTESKTVNENGEEQDRTDLINDLNFVLAFGFGYVFPIKTLRLSIEARYEQGLVNITDFGNPEELFSRTKTQGMNLTIGLGLPLKKRSDE